MAFIHGYEYDVFISFASSDNLVLPGSEHTLTGQFCNNLGMMLARRAGSLDQIKIWCNDKKSDASDSKDLAAKAAIQKSALLLCLHSAGYNASASCREELASFYTKLQSGKGGFQAGHSSRIIHVLLNHIPAASWPRELSGTSPLYFYPEKENTGSLNITDSSSELYKTKIIQLSDMVWSILSELKQAEQKLAGQPGGKTGEKKEVLSVFFSEVADALRLTRKRVITELRSKGFHVLPDITPADFDPKTYDAINDAIKNADVVINLLDKSPGREIIGNPGNWYPKKQTELALKSHTPQMIWMTEETDLTTIKDERYRRFLEGLENGQAASKNYEFVKGSRSTLISEIIGFTEHAGAQKVQQAKNDGVLSVMLDTHYCDQQYATDLGQILADNHVMSLINPQEDDPRKNMTLMRDRLSRVNKLIFLYGAVSEEWLRERMCAALELIVTNHYPIREFFIYLAPPYKEINSNLIKQQFLNIQVINNSKNGVLNPEAIQQFLNELKSSKE